MDATPLLGPQTGIGRYVAELARALVDDLVDPADLRLTTFTMRGREGLRGSAPAGTDLRTRPVPARFMQAAWARTEHPSVRWSAGRVAVFHGTNFVLPPVRPAAGVVTVHDLWFLREPGEVTAATRRYRELVPRSLSRAAVVCTPSAAVADELQSVYPQAAGRVVVTPLGVGPEWFRATPPTKAWLTTRGVRRGYVLFIGSVEPRKSLQTVVDAYKMHGSAEDLPQLVLAGPAGWGAPLDTRGLPSDSVVRLGRQENAALASLVAGAQSLVYPSRYEGFGLPLLEAFACGTPVIASDLPTTREVLGHDTGLARLVPVGDVPRWAEALSDPPAPSAGSIQRRRSVAARFSWTATARSTFEAYRRAADRW